MISVIVPHYCTDKQAFSRCITSLLKDKDADVEVIIVDDGSPEEYLTEIQTYTSDSRVRILFEAHKGVSHARNVGIQEAKGDWLMFVDSDDYLENGYFKTLDHISNESDADIIFFNGYGVKKGETYRNQYFVTENVDYGSSIKNKCDVMGSGLSLGRTPKYYRCLYTLGSPCSKLIKTDFIKNHCILFDEDVRFAEDTLFSLNLIYNANHIYYADAYLYYYIFNDHSATGKYRQGLSKDMDVFFNKARDFIEKHSLNNYLDESYYIRAFLEAQRCIRQELFHKKNTNSQKEKQMAADWFLEQEPYHSALKMKYPYMQSLSCKIASTLLSAKKYGLYMKMYDGMATAKKLLRKA